jgi:8-oxo-dGTP diphosphatase
MAKKHYNVVAGIIVVDDKILCMQRGISKYEYTSKKWEFPGGKIELSETPQEAIIRELREEMDYDVRPIKRLAKIEHEYPDFSISLDAWLCKADSMNFNQKEHIAHCWLKFNELKTLDFAAADVDIINTIKAKKDRTVIIDNSIPFILWYCEQPQTD